MWHLKKILVLVVLIAIGILASELSAQEQESWRNKVKQIEEEPTKVTIETKERAIVFEGDEARKLVQQLKSSPKNLKFITKQIDSDFEIGDDLDSIMTEFVWIEDTSDGLKKIEIEITSEEGDGEKSVTITTGEDGNEKVKVLTGDEAEEYIESHKIKGTQSLVKTKVFMLNDDSDDEEHTLWITDEFEDEGAFEKEIKIELDSLDGGNKVIIKTIKDGDKKVKVLKGDEAEEYIKEHGSHKISKHLLVDCDKEDNVFLIKSKHLKGKENMNWNIVEEEIDEDGNNITKKINFENLDGEKKATITTIKDGDETVEIFEGEEADQILKKYKKSKSMIFISEDGDVSTFDGKTIKVRDSGDGSEIEVEVEIDDDTRVDKKVIIKKKK